MKDAVMMQSMDQYWSHLKQIHTCIGLFKESVWDSELSALLQPRGDEPSVDSTIVVAGDSMELGT